MTRETGKSRAVVSTEVGIVNNMEWMQRERVTLQTGCWAFYVLSSTSFSTVVGVQEARPQESRKWK